MKIGANDTPSRENPECQDPEKEQGMFQELLEVE